MRQSKPPTCISHHVCYNNLEHFNSRKKATTPKKSGMKKPKARSKFKPPANFGVQVRE